jgi:protocatechuate 3,4-dioxygenase beta subunit
MPAPSFVALTSLLSAAAPSYRRGMLAPSFVALVSLLAAALACSVSHEQTVAASPPTTAPASSPTASSPTTPRPLRPVADCEGCEAAWERDPAPLVSHIRLGHEREPGEPFLLRGTIYQADGRTPAAGVVLYLYHTDAAGLYADGTDESEWSRRHGRLRGWLKTGADGRYEVDTILPGQYPGRTDPAHIHMTVLEPGKDPYWIDEVVFAGAPGVDATYASRQQDRGGSGIVPLTRAPDGRWTATRDIVLRR